MRHSLSQYDSLGSERGEERVPKRGKLRLCAACQDEQESLSELLIYQSALTFFDCNLEALVVNKKYPKAVFRVWKLGFRD
jgi:hypothetical protein